jgi:hypothetical protein
MDVLPGQTVPGVLTALPVLAMVDDLGRLVRRPPARLQPLDVERISVVEALRWRSAPSPGIP